jgi:thiol:disulfide interchange protein
VSAVGSLGNRFGRFERISLVIALVWGTGLAVAALVVPVYQLSSYSNSGTATDGSATLVGVNGWGALLVTVAPLAAAMVTGWALWRRAGRQGAGVLAWAVTGLLVCFNLLAMLSIGVFVLPVTLALVVACATHGRKPDGVVTRSGVAG